MKPVLAVRHVALEGLGSIADTLQQADIAYGHVDVFQELPRSFEPEQAAGLIVMGGPMNVDEVQEHPFLGHEVEWIRRAVAARVPVLGICLGAQLLAKALGSRVYPNPVKEIGWLPVQWLAAADEDPLFGSTRGSSQVFQWHGDTFDLPAGAVQLARSSGCEQQAFRYGESAFGLQFHLEMTDMLLDRWLNDPGMLAELSRHDRTTADDIRAQARELLPRLQRLGQLVFGRFAELCQRRL